MKESSSMYASSIKNRAGLLRRSTGQDEYQITRRSLAGAPDSREEVARNSASPKKREGKRENKLSQTFSSCKRIGHFNQSHTNILDLHMQL